jgi:hypothetical protein
MQTYRILRKNGISVEVNIPIEFARTLGLSPGDPTLMSLEGDTIIMKKVTTEKEPVVEAT